MTINHSGIYDTKGLKVKSGYVNYTKHHFAALRENDICVHMIIGTRTMKILLITSEEEFETYLLEEKIHMYLSLPELRKKFLQNFID